VVSLPFAARLPAVDHRAQGVPDIPVEPFSGGRYPGDMDARVAVLEQIARTTAAPLERIERRLDLVAAAQRDDFRWLLGMMVAATGTTLAVFLGLLGVMAHGFHWL
jgi:hypothetical protein